MKERVRAVVRVTMDVEAGSVWSSDTTWDQIAKQAEDGVRGLLLNGNPLTMKDLPRRILSLTTTAVIVRKEADAIKETT